MATSTNRTDPALWIVLAVVLLLGVPMALMLGFWGSGMMGGGWMGSGGGGWWGLGSLLGLGVLFLVLYLIVKAFQSAPIAPAPPPYGYAAMAPAPPPAANALQILDARYAKGEITRDEYLRMRADLEGPPR